MRGGRTTVKQEQMMTETALVTTAAGASWVPISRGSARALVVPMGSAVLCELS